MENNQNDNIKTKAISPNMMVMRRFLKNKLAIIGVCILLFVFVYAFIIGIFLNYSSTQVFYIDKLSTSELANAEVFSSLETKETNYIYYPNYEKGIDIADVDFMSQSINSAIKSLEDGSTEKYFGATKEGVSKYVLYKLTKNTKTDQKGKIINNYYKIEMETFDEDPTHSPFYYDGIKEKFFDNKEQTIEHQDQDGLNEKIKSAFKCSSLNRVVPYLVAENNNEKYVIKLYDALFSKYEVVKVSAPQTTILTEIGYANYQVIDINIDIVDATEKNNFIYQAYQALFNGINTFSFNTKSYEIENMHQEEMTIKKGNKVVGVISNIKIGFTGTDKVDFDSREFLRSKEKEFATKQLEKLEFELDGKKAYIEKSGSVDSIKITKKDTLIDKYASPNAKHLLGTDANGRDVLIRTISGGRISLMVGVVVMLISVVIAVIVGGIAGFFGGKIDNLLMRFVDFIRCIPFLPVMIILGAYFDYRTLASMVRIFWMIIIMGVMFWPSLARVIRGQILSLKEQEYMIAAKAAGIPVFKRIFKHLIPNVMPYIIVNATMGIGDIIITESTLSFLGIGAKYPMATWGSMISSIRGSMATIAAHWFVWVPVGILISATVIAFNFVGDGLRDAYDPKAKK